MKYKLLPFFIILCSQLTFNIAESKVFDFEKKSFSPYIKGFYMFNHIESDAYSNSSGSNTTFADSPTFTGGGELGLSMHFGSFSLSLGYEIIMPQKMTSISGKNGSTELMTLDSSVTALLPKLRLDVYLYKTSQFRFYLGYAVTQGALSVKNIYTMTAAGKALYSISEDTFTEQASQSAMGHEGLIGIEYHLASTVTFLLDISYRMLDYNSLKHKANSSNPLLSTSSSEGAALVKNDGSNRPFNLTGMVSSFGFRFYL